MRILLTGARAPVALDLARRLTKAGHHVHLADSLRYGCAALSRFKESMTRLPRPVEGPRAYLQAVNETIRKLAIDLVIPTCEEVFFLGRFKDQVACECLIDDFEVLNRIHNKYDFTQTVNHPSVQAPETHLLQRDRDVSRFMDESEDWVFKPVYSRFASETQVGPNSKKLKRLKISPTKTWVAQRRIRGRELATWGLAKQGTLLAYSCYYAAHRVAGSSGIYFQDWADSRIIDFVRDYVARMKYTGQIAFDLILDSEDHLWVLEGNPRSTSGLHRFPDDSDLSDRFTGSTAELVDEELLIGQRDRPQMVAIAMMLWASRQCLLAGRPGQFFRDFRNAEDVVWSREDWMPTLGLPLSIAELVGISVRHWKTLPQATTYDIEWNGEPID